MALAIVACGEEEKIRTESPAFNQDAEQVFFYNNNPSSLELLPTDSVFEIVIGREVYEYANDVKIKLVDNTGAFTIPSSVSFAAGDSVDTIQVWVDMNKLEFFTDYQIEISIDDSKSLNPYVVANGVPNWTINVIVSDFEVFDAGVFESTLWEDAWEQDLLYSKLKNAFRLVDPYGEGSSKYMMEFQIDSTGAFIGGKKDSDGCYIYDVFTYGSYGKVTMHVYGGKDYIDYTKYDPATKTLSMVAEFTVLDGKGSFGTYQEFYYFDGAGIPWVKGSDEGGDDDGGDEGGEE